MFFSVLATALVVLAGSTRAIPATSAVPSAPGGCATPSDGSFKLTAVTADGSQKFPVKVLQSPGENPNITQFIMLVANDQVNLLHLSHCTSYSHIAQTGLLTLQGPSALGTEDHGSRANS